MNILMLGPWLPTTRRPLANERLHQFARHLAKDHRLTLACATDHPNPIGAVSALREQFDDLEFAVVPNRWKRLLSVAHLAVGSSAEVAYFTFAGRGAEGSEVPSQLSTLNPQPAGIRPLPPI